ncbi:hypothetical protein GCM10022237_07090 [Nocardioides ginsengisoli]|uniref:GerMN domain-containing protein n=1 Tax=Nocardioides ginsengisoli TaxID=363868 RepID=A0ABW3VVW3_9ACTN
MRRATVLLAGLALLAAPTASSRAATSAGAATTAVSAACQSPVVGPAPTRGQAFLDGVRAGRHDRAHFDRVVFDLTAVAGYDVHYVRRIVQDGSGLPLRLRGRAVLAVRLAPVRAHDDRGRSTAPRRIVRSFTQLRDVRRAGDFEGVVTYGVGLAARGDFRVSLLTRPDRLVVDVAFPGRHPFDCRRGAVEVFFATRDATAAAVTRRVPTPAVARGALTALFAGPVDFDRPRGLVLVDSGAVGFTGLRIRDGIARVRLTGGCASGGSTFTIANEIVPTLKRLPTVDVVKILDPQGHTEEPAGRVDSIPACLEP